jgi:hypothetical protein
MTAFWRWFGVCLLAAALLAGLIVGGWQAGWWFSNQNNSRQAHMIRNGYANQQTLREQITTQIGNVDSETVQVAQAAGDQAEVSALESQRIATVNIACQDASQITGDPLPAQQAQWVSANCLAGVIRPGSRYDTTGGN